MPPSIDSTQDFEPLSIEWFATDPGPCVACTGEVGRGPGGFRKGENNEPIGPVCDLCLLELHSELGMLLLFANAGRQLASQMPDTALDADRNRVALMTFAKIYDLGAKWPCRPIAVMDFMRDFLQQLLKRLARIPFDAIVNVIGGVAH